MDSAQERLICAGNPLIDKLAHHRVGACERRSRTASPERWPCISRRSWRTA